MDKKHASLTFTVKEVDPEKFQLKGVFSTGDEDRHGERIDQNGWKLDNFLKNPVILWAHDQLQPAVGKAMDLGFEDGKLVGTIQFAAEEYEFAKTIYNLYAGGYLNAFSVGFMNNKWQYNEETDELVLLENELYEISCVNVPANALALAKSKGIDVSILENRKKKADLITEKIAKNEDTVEEETKPIEETGEGEEEVVTTEEQNKEDEVKSAMEVILKAGPTKIQEAVTGLTENLQDADKKAEVETTPVAQGRKSRIYSTHEINRVIRSLMKASK